VGTLWQTGVAGRSPEDRAAEALMGRSCLRAREAVSGPPLQCLCHLKPGFVFMAHEGDMIFWPVHTGIVSDQDLRAAVVKEQAFPEASDG
jgi:hypothetical protein